MEDLQEAGINVGNMSELSEDQVQALVAISQRRQQQQQQPVHQPSTSQGRTAAAVSLGTPHGGNMPPVLEPMPLSSVPAGSELNGYHAAAGQENYDRVDAQQRPPQQQLMLDVESEDARESQITITITDEGHVKLTDAAQQTFFFSRDELAQRNIDASDLTDANIQQLIQMAMPSLDVGSAEGAAPRKRQRVESTASTSAAPAPADHYYSRPVTQVNQQQPSTSGVQQYAPNTVTNQPAAPQSAAAAPQPPRPVRLLTGHIPGAAAGENNAVVVRNGPAPMSLQFGDEVDVRKDGRIVPAVIRYSRTTQDGTGFKVQFHVSVH
ncbi:hypothetical protein AAVH_11576 [Aphelenchoides avenae]|nr:hypothetical protein AAVH_11576 [Aphelenchus avenae]